MSLYPSIKSLLFDFLVLIRPFHYISSHFRQVKILYFVQSISYIRNFRINRNSPQNFDDLHSAHKHDALQIVFDGSRLHDQFFLPHNKSEIMRIINFTQGGPPTLKFLCSASISHIAIKYFR